MKNSFVVLAMLATSLVCSTLPAGAVSNDEVSRFAALAPKRRPRLLTYDLNAMTEAILARVAGRPFTAHQMLGYSGATYADLAAFEAQFRARCLEVHRRTVETLGPGAVTVYILGATLDGFGKGYAILRDLIARGDVTNALVTGMASSEAIVYHLEGLAKGWGDVISPDQEIAFFKTTYRDALGNRSWELKISESDESDTPKILKELSRAQNAGVMTFSVFGGGMQAFNETLELVLESRHRPQLVEVDLFLGHAPGKVAKDTGYRAADMLAFVLSRNRYLINSRLEVRTISRAGEVRPVASANLDPDQKQLAADFAVASEWIAMLGEPTSPELRARRNYFSVLIQLPQLPLHEIQKFRERSSRQIAEARHLLAQDAPPRSILGGAIDQCVARERDAIDLLGAYRSLNSSCATNLEKTR